MKEFIGEHLADYSTKLKTLGASIVITVLALVAGLIWTFASMFESGQPSMTAVALLMLTIIGLVYIIYQLLILLRLFIKISTDFRTTLSDMNKTLFQSNRKDVTNDHE